MFEPESVDENCIRPQPPPPNSPSSDGRLELSILGIYLRVTDEFKESFSGSKAQRVIFNQHNVVALVIGHQL